MKQPLSSLFLATALVTGSAGAEQRGPPTVEMMGPGTVACVNWTYHHAASGSGHPIAPSPVAAAVEDAWVGGFLSGLGAAGWGHPLAGSARERVFSWIALYCIDHPKETIAEAATAFARETAR